MKNIKFIYLYRDGSNYKKWAEVVFVDADDLSTEAIAAELRQAFMADGLFVAHQVRIPETFLAFEDHLTPDDHCFHEFDGLEVTPDVANDLFSRSIQQFMTEVKREAEHGWRAFDPQDRLQQQIR